MTYVVESATRVVFRAAAEVGEGPVASADGRSVDWVDIFDGAVYTTDVESGHTTHVRVATFVGAVARRAEAGFVAATREGFATISPQGRLVTRRRVLSEGLRMNDGKCDSAGRFWAGSTAMDFAVGRGELHVLRPDWTTARVLDGLTLPNGLGWSPDDATFYLIDSLRRTLTAYGFDPRSGELSDGRVLTDFATEPGVPDGLTVDAGGDIWVAMWGGGAILRLSAHGDVRQRIDVPVTQPSSCAFAGPGRDILVVTSASQGLDIRSGEGTLDGSLLGVSGLDSRGLPSHEFAG